MCYPEGSVQHAVNVCPMCKVFPHPARCPHLREVCRNRSLHPRADYLFLTNAEVETFNGCGFCKWARSDHSVKASAMNNPGWPGCCRPPASNEYRMIPAADWRSVSIVHNVSLPPEIKSALDILSPPKVSSSTLSSLPSLKNPKSAVPPLDRRNSGSPPSRAMVSSKSSAAVASTSPKARSGGSPKQSAASLSGSMSRATGSVTGFVSASPDQPGRRTGGTDATEKSGSRSAHSSPSRKQLDLDSQTSPRRNSGGRASTSTTTSPTSPSGKTVGERFSASTTSDRRRATISATHPPNSSLSIRNPTSTASFLLPKSSQKDAGNMSSDSTSNNGSDDRSSDSMSDSTITSDGGFTDYLSDESEAELQRQAEARAALLAQNQAEEMEFKAARQRLAHIDLNPPKSWNPTNITNNTNVPRLAQTGKV